MSKVSYILGAGASYGSPRKESLIDSTRKDILRGLPILQEFSEAVEQLLVELIDSNDTNYILKKDVTSNVLNDILSVSHAYPTIDTYAKMLYATQQTEKYEKFKDQLALFFLIWQKEHKHDLRYDSFIASLIDAESGQLPSITILSWNYDMQFEMSYANYVTEERALWRIWDQLNVYSKSNKTLQYNANNPFAFIKLNGSAMFHTSRIDEHSSRNVLQDVIWSRTTGKEFWTEVHDILQKGLERYRYIEPVFSNELSYAWENNGKKDLLQNISIRVEDCEAVVVIGYSFPYVNREIDRHIFNSMPFLKHIYIQDKNGNAIKERIQSIYEYIGKTVPIIDIKEDIDNFFIPNELG